MFLTIEELNELTGYVYHCRQIEWLQRHHWKFEVTAQRRPKVARTYFEMRLGGATTKQDFPVALAIARPNFQAIGQLRGR